MTSATACLQFAPTGQVHVAWNPDSTFEFERVSVTVAT
jgi:hypothetical protein